MLRTFTIYIFIMMFITGFSQTRQGSDGLYYDEQGKKYTGTCHEYYADSITRASIAIKDGHLDGVTMIYFENGQLEEIRSYKNGMMHGIWEKWNRQNIKIGEANYTDNKKDGKWYIWDEFGILRYDMTYKDGEKRGTWYMYDDKGTLIDQKDY